MQDVNSVKKVNYVRIALWIVAIWFIILYLKSVFVDNPCDLYNNYFSKEINARVELDKSICYEMKNIDGNYFLWIKDLASDSIKMIDIGDRVIKPANSEECIVLHGKETLRFRMIIYEKCTECIEWKKKHGK